MKIKDSLNITILIGILLFSSLCMFIRPVEAQSGYNLWTPSMVNDENYYGNNKNNKLYQNTLDTSTINLFSENGKYVKYISPSDKKEYGRRLYIPVPLIAKRSFTDKQGNSGYIDDLYPDNTFASPKAYNEAKLIDTGYQKQCRGSEEASVIFYIQIQDLVTINADGSDASLLDLSTVKTGETRDPSKLHFLSTQLKDNNAKIILEYCYNKEIIYNGQKATIEGKTFSRKIIGSNALSRFDAFPPRMQQGQYTFSSNFPLSKGLSISDSSFVKVYPAASNISQGYQYGEYSIGDNNNPLDCKLDNPIVKTDLFGKPIKGVDTALGCLPGSFEGIFTVVLRISTGISAAALLILIIFNAINLMQSNSNPDAIKKLVSNISRGIMALIIILFAVVFLNIVGVKILDLNAFGSVGLEQIVGN